MPSTTIAEIHPDTDTPMQAAVWMAQDLGIELPPIPDVYAGKLVEGGHGQLFSTDAALSGLDSRESIAEALVHGWPVPGLAFGNMSRGTWAHWFYTLVGERQILHVSSRLDRHSDTARSASAVLLDQVHSLLAAHLDQESQYFQAINPEPPIGGAKRRVIVISDDAASTFEESIAYWVPGQTTSAFEPWTGILQTSLAVTQDSEVLFRA